MRTVVRVAENFHRITTEVIIMSRYTSEQTAYSSLKNKYVPLWSLDTNTMTVTNFNPDTQTEESKTYHIDFIRYHLHYSDSHVLTGFAGSSTMGRSFSTLMIWNWKSVKLSPIRWSFGNRQTVTIIKLSSQAIPRRCSVLKTASIAWRENQCLSVWFIFEEQRLCLRVQPF